MASLPVQESRTQQRPEQQSAEARPIVEARSLSVTFTAKDGPVRALDSVDLIIRDGDFVSLIGPSGCGKTTLLRVIADLEQPTGGEITVNGLDPQSARLARAYGYVFQAPALLPWRTVEGNVMLPLSIMGFDRAERRRRAAEQLERVGLSGFGRAFPWQLSGGMQQRVSIARALAFDPRLLLMDEPFGALDEITRDHLNLQLTQLWRRTGKTCVFVTHSIAEAVFLSTRIIVMSPRPGRILSEIPCDLPADRTLELRESAAFQSIAAEVRAGLKAGHSYDA